MMLALYTGCLIATLAAAKPVRAGLVLIVVTALSVYLGTRLFGLNAYVGGLSLILNGFFAAIFVLTGVVILAARKALK
jgi:hypothetical protein